MIIKKRQDGNLPEDINVNVDPDNVDLFNLDNINSGRVLFDLISRGEYPRQLWK